MQEPDLFSSPSPATDPDEIWACAKEDLRARIEPNHFSQYFDALKLRGVENGKFVFYADEFSSFFVTKNYADVVREALFKASGRTVDFEILSPGLKDPDAERQNSRRADTSAAKPERPPRVLPPAIRACNTFENFVRGPENEMALAASIGIADNLTDPDAQNPLFIYGPSGVGKTHLLHAIANRAAQKNPQARICYVTCETFTNEFTASLQASGNESQFRRKFREQDLLLVDDIQFLKGKERTQEAFFHTFNSLCVNGGKIVLTSDRPAHEIDIDDRLVSRFQQGISADINPPCLETRIAILQEKARFRHFHFEDFPGTLDFVAQNITRNVRNLEGALNKMLQYISLKKCTVLPREILENLLGDLLAQEGTVEITADFIQQQVAKYFKLDVGKMKEKVRTANIAFARQVAMYLCCELTNMKLTEIGAAFGGRDHGTVIHARKTVQDRIDTEAKDKRAVEFLREKIASARP
ncbi:MAG: chromosomal replication initiator protein DnaA [Opitutae bacterium]|nr:chromosomal replication initiator protein DnaA [Opitutae bacterium]